MVKLHHQKSEEELSDSEDKWEEYIEGIKTIQSLIKDLQQEVTNVENSEVDLDEKIQQLEDLNSLNKSHTNKSKQPRGRPTRSGDKG